MRKAVAVLILGLIAPVMAGAQDLASLEQMRQSAAQGNADAQLDMGILYEFGYNLPKNDVTALAWYLRAADQGNALAAQRRDLLKSRMKPEEIDAAEKLSSELTVKKTGSAETPPAAQMKPENTGVAPAAEEKSPAAEPAAEKPSSTP
jgi:TPR repeat protein